MRTVLVFLLLLAIAIAQSTVGQLLSVLGVVPNAVLVAVVCSGLLGGDRVGTLWGLLGGLALGLLSSAPLGVHALVLALIGYLAGAVRRSPFQSLFVVPLLASAAATVLYLAGVGVLLRLSGWPLAIEPELVYIVAWAVLMNGALMLICYWWAAHLVETRGRFVSGF